MRFRLLVLLLSAVAVPAAAQPASLDKRVGKLEDEMHAVQRKVFPAGPEVQPEIAPALPSVAPGGVPATSPVADLTARVDALEGQLARLTGQVEEDTNRIRQLEESVGQLKAAPPVPAPAGPPDVRTTSDGSAPHLDTSLPASTGDPAEDAYNAGYKLWAAKDYAGAEQVLEGLAKKYPKHRRASWARNLAGRAYLDDGKPASAAKVLLSNYQTDPKGERAADSLFYLGQALMQLDKSAQACQVYDELQNVYGEKMRDALRDRLPKARADAKCS